jgi:hypothetical protein
MDTVTASRRHDQALAAVACLVGGILLYIGVDLATGGRLSGTHHALLDDLDDELAKLAERGK